MSLKDTMAEVTSLLKETAENSKSMGDELRKVRESQDAMLKVTKANKTESKPFEGMKPPSDDDDMAKAKAQNESVRNSMKDGSRELETKEQKELREDKEYKRDLLKAQKTTNDYLKSLTALEEVAKKPEYDSVAANIYKGTSEYLKGTRFQTMQGIGGMMESGASAISTAKKIWNAPQTFKDYREKKSMDKEQKIIKKNQALLAAQEHKLKSKKDLSEEDRQKLLDKIASTRKTLDTSTDAYSKQYASRYMRLKKRSDSAYKGISKDEMGDLQEHIQSNLSERFKTESDYLQRSKLSQPKDNIKNIPNPKVTASYIGTGGSNSIFNGGLSIAESQGLSGRIPNENKEVERATTQRLLDMMFGRKISQTPSPKTYGEYVAGIFHQLKDSNEFLEKIYKNTRDMKSSGSDEESGFGAGGLLSALGRGLGKTLGMAGRGIGMLGSFLTGGLGLGGLLTTGVGSLGTLGAGGMIGAGGLLAGSAAGGLAIGNKAAEMMGMHENGASLGDVGSGLKGAWNGKGFSNSMENAQIERKVNKQQQEQIDSARKAFDESLKSGTQHPSMVAVPPDIAGDMTDMEKTKVFDLWLGATLLKKVPMSSYRSGKHDIIKSVIQRMDSSKAENEDYQDLLKNRGKGGEKGSSLEGGRTPSGSVQSAQPTVEVKTTMSGISGALGQDQLNAMQMQAKLIAYEMMIMQSNPKYVEQQVKYARQQGNSVATTMFGG